MLYGMHANIVHVEGLAVVSSSDVPNVNYMKI